MDALCAEPAIAALGRQMRSVPLTVASANADVYVGHPGISGILYLENHTPLGGFDRTLVVPAGTSAMTLAERVACAAEALGVSVERREPQIYLTSLDALRTERLELGGPQQPIMALCMGDDAGDDRWRRWEGVCRTLKDEQGTAIVLLSGRRGALDVYKNLAGRLMPREAAAVLSRCAVWLGDDPTYAALAGAVGLPGVFVSDAAVFEAGGRVGLCPADAPDERILAMLERMRCQPPLDSPS